MFCLVFGQTTNIYRDRFPNFVLEYVLFSEQYAIALINLLTLVGRIWKKKKKRDIMGMDHIIFK